MSDPCFAVNHKDTDEGFSRIYVGHSYLRGFAPLAVATSHVKFALGAVARVTPINCVM